MTTNANTRTVLAPQSTNAKQINRGHGDSARSATWRCYRFAGLVAGLVAVVLGSIASPARARTVEPGTVSATVNLGPGVRLGSRLGGSESYLLLSSEIDYAVSKAVSVVGDITFGVAATNPLRFSAGPRVRLTGLDSLWSPYVAVQASVGRLFGVINTDLMFMGGRAFVGTDYFLTGQIAAGAFTGVTLATTLSDRPSFYGIWELFFYGRYWF